MEVPCDKIQHMEIYDSIRKLFRENGYKKVFICEKTIKSGRNSGSVSQYSLCIIVGLKDSILDYEDLLKYIAESIKEKLANAGDFLNMCKGEYGRQHLFGNFRKKWILLGNFVECYMRKRGLPDPEILTELSATRYEGSESEARIYFTDKAVDTIETFDAAGKEDREMKGKNLRMIRKLMEISKRDIVHLYAERHDEDVPHIISKLVRYDGKRDEDIYVKFSGFMHWSLFEGKREVFQYYHGRYELNASGENQAYLSEINKLKGVDIKMTEELVKILRMQEHGTVAILFDEETDIETEVERLCNMKRGIRITSNICYDETEGWDEEQILSVTGIDGALFIDHGGKCRALGVIVDGKAVMEGDVGRGARYNSIVNYMKLNPKCVGIIVSEDRMVDIIQNPQKSA